MHSSYFGYSITRPYPYRWFTPVAVVGGIALLVLFSVLNFVQNSYILAVQYVEEPNSTISQGILFKDWPSYITRSVRPTCEPANLPLNTQLFTNQSGLTWTLTSVVNGSDSSLTSPSLTYMNNVLENCTVSQIQMVFDGTQSRDVAVSSSTPWDVQVRAFVTCGIWTPTGHSFVNMTAMYDAIQPYTVAGSSIFVATNSQTRASMYWAEALLSAYWVDTANRLNAVSLDLQPSIINGYANLFPIDSQTEITDLGFFDVAFDFLYPSESSGFGWHGPLASIQTYFENSDIALSPKPQIWLQVDFLAKAMYSAVLADLGQVSQLSRDDLLTNPSTLQLFTSNFSSISVASTLYYKQIEMQDFDTRQKSANPTGPLGITPSVLTAKYLCQVPQRKPLGDIFISVLLADLVLLSAAWKLYSLAVGQILTRRKHTAKYCEGCVSKRQDVEEGLSGLMTSSAFGKKTSGAISVTAVQDISSTHDVAGETPWRWKGFWRM